MTKTILGNNMQTTKILAQAASLILRAGELSVSFRSSVTINNIKSQGNYVTNADLLIEQFLISELRKLTPNDAIYTEETMSTGFKESGWVLDPIDGTGNYLYGFPYAISLAYIENGDTQFGFVYNPSADELWWASLGCGAYSLSQASCHREDSLIDLFGCSTGVKLNNRSSEGGIILFGMPYDRTKARRLLSDLDILFQGADDLKRIGPASLDICRVANNQAKLYIELDLELWDYAASNLILKEAGGSSVHLDDVFLFGSSEAINWAITTLNLPNCA